MILRINSSSRFKLPVADDGRLHFELLVEADYQLHFQLSVADDRQLYFEPPVTSDGRLHLELPVAGDRHPVTILPLTDRQVVQLHPGNRPLARLLPPEKQTVTFTRLKITEKKGLFPRNFFSPCPLLPLLSSG